MRLCQEIQTPSGDSIAEFLRKAFVELLKYLNADRQTAPNGILLWKCELCGLETTGMGIHSHQNKHCSEYRYLIDRENEIRRKPFLERIAPYQIGIDKVIEAARSRSKIEQANYIQSERIFDLFKQERIPTELWLQVGNRLQFCFSNRAFVRFQDEIIDRLRLQGIEPLQEPPLIWNTYENILRLFEEESKVHGGAAQQAHAADPLQRASPASAGS